MFGHTFPFFNQLPIWVVTCFATVFLAVKSSMHLSCSWTSISYTHLPEAFGYAKCSPRKNLIDADWYIWAKPFKNHPESPFPFVSWLVSICNEFLLLLRVSFIILVTGSLVTRGNDLSPLPGRSSRDFVRDLISTCRFMSHRSASSSPRHLLRSRSLQTLQIIFYLEHP